MDSALRPREIQARIRAGESLADVAERAGVPQERIEVYATPVLAERGHIAATAMTASARRRGDASGHRNLRTILSERLTARGVDVESVDWDAWKLPDRRWRVEARYSNDPRNDDEAEESDHVVALFTFDPAGRFSVAANNEARWLLGELSTTRAGDRHSVDEDGEPTIDLDDEFALVRALGRGAKPTNGDHEASRSDSRQGQRSDPLDPEAQVEQQPSSSVTRAPDLDESDSAASPSAETAPAEASKRASRRRRSRSREATSSRPEEKKPKTVQQPEPMPGTGAPEDVYDVLPTPESELDALYEMLGGFNEDSVNIYAGLNEPVTEPAPTATPTTPTPTEEPRLETETEPAAKSEAESDAEAESETKIQTSSEGDELEQPSLIEETDSPAAAKKPRGNKKRASIPSWDEIMFGGPKP